LLLKTAYENTKSSGYNTVLDTQSKSLTKLSTTAVLEPQLFKSLKIILNNTNIKKCNPIRDNLRYGVNILK